MEKQSMELSLPFATSLALKITRIEDDSQFSKLNSFNYFTVVLLLNSSGELLASTSSEQFDGHNLMSFSIYQQFAIRCKGRVEGYMINFHPDFFCLHQHRHEVSCNGILFNNIYETALTVLTTQQAMSLQRVIEGMEAELRRHDAAEAEVLLAYLKILLINGSRIKIENNERAKLSPGHTASGGGVLYEAIENNFRKLHAPSGYAKLLHVTPTALNRLSKKSFNKTLSALITERIIVEAKRQLYLTAKPVKLIAFELGFTDEFYFSRYFKTNVKVSPQMFRDTVGADKAKR